MDFAAATAGKSPCKQGPRKRCFALGQCCEQRPQFFQSCQICLACPFKIRLDKLWMVEVGGKTLLPPRVMRRRIRAANIATDDGGSCADLSKRPLKISRREAATLPVCPRLLKAQAIEIERDVDIFTSDAFQKIFKTPAPIVAQDCALALSILHGPIVCPRMHIKNSGAFRAAVAENLVWPPAFEIAATPNTRARHIWRFQRA